jgi:apolipoprotein N-acyltransferase
VISAAPPPRRALLAALSGVLLFLSFPKFGHGAVAWVALLPLLLALPGATAGQAFRLGYLTGLISAVGLLYWTAFVVVQYGGLSLGAGIAAMLVLSLAVAALAASWAWAVARLLHRFGPAAFFAAPAVWVAIELVRVHTLLRFPWCLLGYSQHRMLPFVQVASVTAVYGVSFLVASGSALLAYSGTEPRRGRRRGALLALAVMVLGTWSLGLRAMSVPVREEGRTRVGLVQGGIRQEDKWVPEHAWANVARHVELTERAAREGARLVIWPESAVPFRFDEAPVLAETLRDLVRRERIHLFFGNDDIEREAGAGRRIFVGAKMLDPGGEVTYRYRKIQLVPFGEYVPLRPVFTLGGRLAAKVVAEVSDFTPGSEPSVGRVGERALGGFICYEAIFPALVRAFTTGGAELLVNVTNDAWYGTTSAPYQHMAMAVFRAVENRRYLVRAANTGITAVVDPRGRVLDPTRLFETTVLVRDVPFVAERTFYTRNGDIFAVGCLLGTALLLVLTLRPPWTRMER